MKGRFHHYEGYDMKTAAFGVMTMAKLGISKLLITNAAGGINKYFGKGCLMIITDHIGFFGPSPLRGGEFGLHGPRFPDMSEVYSKRLIGIAEECAKNVEIPVRKGVYCYSRGPQFETPAEIRAMGILGADAVGMSTVPEAIAARYSGMETLGISCITNMAAGLGDAVLTHEDVIETTAKVRESFIKYVRGILSRMED
jgi:purine-nucleoside phosphorylase